MNSFQERLNDLLVDNNLSRLQLAKILNISSTTINGYFNKNYYPELNIAINIAKYFNCSLDFLFGISDSEINTNTNRNSFFINLQQLIKENKTSIAKTFKNLNMSEYNYQRWKKGQIPKTINLIQIVEYFNLSLDYLVGNVL